MNRPKSAAPTRTANRASSPTQSKSRPATSSGTRRHAGSLRPKDVKAKKVHAYKLGKTVSLLQWSDMICRRPPLFFLITHACSQNKNTHNLPRVAIRLFEVDDILPFGSCSSHRPRARLPALQLLGLQGAAVQGEDHGHERGAGGGS